MKNVIDFTKFFSYREREAAEVDRLRNMTEEERRLESKMNPKKISNKGNFAQCGNLAILLSLRFYVKFNFGEFKWFKKAIFGNFRDSHSTRE